MEPRRGDLDLTTELRALRPSPRPEFIAELDRRAEAGFPRWTGDSANLIERATARLRVTAPRRLLLPTGAFAVAAIVVATAIVAATDNGTAPPLSFRAKMPDEIASPVKSAGAAGGAERQSKHANGAASAEDSSGIQYSEVPPTASRGSRLGQSAAAGAQPLSSSAGETGPFASHTRHRNIERAAQIVLGADPTDVRSDAAKVFDVVHATDGIVLRSSIRDGTAGEAGASFDLLIPSGKVGDTLAAFSAIDEVRSRHESTQDITAPTVSIGEKLQDSRAKIEGLLAQLATTTTDTQRTAVEAELRAERAHAAALRSRLADLNRRANLSRVSLRIDTGESSGRGSTDGTWGTGDGLHDARRILAIAAGVTLVGLAVIAPLALIFLFAWLAYRAWIRSRREQALSRRV
jgi:hypothetical protein